MLDGIEGDAAQHAGGGITEAIGHPGVRGFVQAERKKEHSKLEDGNDDMGLIHRKADSMVSGVQPVASSG
jgi:hypothetical protein